MWLNALAFTGASDPFAETRSLMQCLRERFTIDRHSGLDPESSVLGLDFHFVTNDKTQIIVKSLL